jgi:hypothetical protein
MDKTLSIFDAPRIEVRLTESDACDVLVALNVLKDNIEMRLEREPSMSSDKRKFQMGRIPRIQAVMERITAELRSEGIK